MVMAMPPALASMHRVNKLKSIEDIVGSAYDDVLTGDAGDNSLWGGAGGDTLDGGMGYDTVFYVDPIWRHHGSDWDCQHGGGYGTVLLTQRATS